MTILVINMVLTIICAIAFGYYCYVEDYKDKDNEK